MICCVCGKEINKSYAPSYCNGNYCANCASRFYEEAEVEVEKDILKALECCIKLYHDCKNCPLQKEVSCTAILKEKILKYIKK